MRYVYKIEKGELYLTLAHSTDPKVKPDFSGKTAMVRILKREKK